jgi:hypothetical protein
VAGAIKIIAMVCEDIAVDKMIGSSSKVAPENMKVRDPIRRLIKRESVTIDANIE